MKGLTKKGVINITILFSFCLRCFWLANNSIAEGCKLKTSGSAAFSPSKHIFKQIYPNTNVTRNINA